MATIHWSVSDLMDVIRGLRVTHLDDITLMPECELSDSPVDNHICPISKLTWMAPVDILVMRTLLKCFTILTVEMESCRIMNCDTERVIFNRMPKQMVI